MQELSVSEANTLAKLVLPFGAGWSVVLCAKLLRVAKPRELGSATVPGSFEQHSSKPG